MERICILEKGGGGVEDSIILIDFTKTKGGML